MLVTTVMGQSGQWMSDRHLTGEARWNQKTASMPTGDCSPGREDGTNTSQGALKRKGTTL